MSKIFEALQRLERETGKLPAGVLAEAQRVLTNGAATLDSVPSREWVMPDTVASAVASAPPVVEEIPALAAALDAVPVDDIAIKPESRIIYYSDPNSPGADRFRLLRMRLLPLKESGRLKALLITSAQAEEGKSTVALNLATALAERGEKKVVLIEGDLYHRSLAKKLGIGDYPGLADCLEDGRDPLTLLRRIEPLGWYLLPAGEPRRNPTELLQSSALANIFDTVRSHFDWVLVDTPPVVPLTDTLSLRKSVDACLFVVRADRTPRDAVDAAIRRLGSKNILGIVLNDAHEVDRLYRSYYGKGYARGKAS